MRMSSLQLAATVALALLSTLPAQERVSEQAEAVAESEDACRSARDQLMRAIYAVDFDGMRAARKQLVKLFENPELGADAMYHAAHADWWLSREAGIDPRVKGERLDRAIAALSRSVEIEAESADSQALLAWLCFLRIGTAPQMARELGPRQGMAMEIALELGPDNPRVVLLDAMSLFSLPAEHGGDREKALSRFKEAREMPMLESDEKSSGPIWGRAEVWGESGLYLMSAGKVKEAVAALEHALEIQPDWRMVKDRALPRARRMLEEK